MNYDVQIQSISAMCSAWLENEPGYFLVEVRITAGNNIQVFIDGDAGVTIDKCVALNRTIYKQIEETGVFTDGDFSLEVSSPGLDEPIKLHRQYQKNIGRHLEIWLDDDTQLEGKLVKVNPDDIVIEQQAGKKKPVTTQTILFQHIKTTKILVVF